MRNLATFSAFLIWAFANLNQAASKRLQMFTLYTDTGQSENFTSNVHDLEQVSNIVKSEDLTSVCSQIGVWAFFSSKDFADKNAYGYHPATPDWTCNSRRIGADHGFAAVNSIRHLGNSDLDVSAISLYTEAYFANHELYFNGEIISLPISHKFYSYGFTGMDSWTLFASINFTGESVCLRPNLTEYSNVTFNTEREITVGSIVKGCLRTPRLLPIGSVFHQNNEIGTLMIPKVNISGNKTDPQCLELQDGLLTSVLLISGNELRLPEPEPFDSFTIQKNSSWTIYKGPEFDGESICLKINDSEMKSSKEVVNYKFMPAPFLIGSVRQGCEEKNETNLPDEINISTTGLLTPPPFKPDDLSETTDENQTQNENTTPETFTENAASNRGSDFDQTDNPNSIISSTDNPNLNSNVGIINSAYNTFNESEVTENSVENNFSSSNSLISHDTNSPNSEISTRRGKQLDFNKTTKSSTSTNESSENWGTEKSTMPNYEEEYDISTEYPNEHLRNLVDLTSSSTTHDHENLVEEPNVNVTKSIDNWKIDPNLNENPKLNTAEKTQELISNAGTGKGTGTFFFTAILIVLGLLIGCMLITLGFFAYYRVRRSRNELSLNA